MKPFECNHEIDEEKTRELNHGFCGCGTQEYICKNVENNMPGTF